MEDSASDGTLPTASPALRVAVLRNDDQAVRQLVARLVERGGAMSLPASEVRTLLQGAVPEYAGAVRASTPGIAP